MNTLARFHVNKINKSGRLMKNMPSDIDKRIYDVILNYHEQQPQQHQAKLCTTLLISVAISPIHTLNLKEARNLHKPVKVALRVRENVAQT
jgi:hypothetical protein